MGNDRDIKPDRPKGESGHYPHGLPEELRDWYDSITVDDEPLSPEDEAAHAAGLRDAAAGRMMAHGALDADSADAPPSTTNKPETNLK